MKLVVHPDFIGLEPFLRSLPDLFDSGEGEVLHCGRNEIRRLAYQGRDYVVKSFGRPHLLNRFVYGTLRGSKACRSYRRALDLLRIGVGTPTPVGYVDIRHGLQLERSYYVSLLSPCPYAYPELYSNGQCVAPMSDSVGPCPTSEVLLEIGRVTALIHQHGYLHRDYSRGNILFGQGPDGRMLIQIVDLNRMLINRHIGLRRGCKNFERLPATPEMRHSLAQGYAEARGFDADMCEYFMAHYRQKQPERIPGVDVF